MDFALHKGVVKDTEDPDGFGRIEIEIDDQGTRIWALPCAPVAGPSDSVFLRPELDSSVWYLYEEGNTQDPVWLGGFWPGNDDGTGNIVSTLENVPEGPDVSFIRIKNIELVFTDDGLIIRTPKLSIESENEIEVRSEDELKISSARDALVESDRDLTLKTYSALYLDGLRIEMTGWPLKFSPGKSADTTITELQNRIATLEALVQTLLNQNSA